MTPAKNPMNELSRAPRWLIVTNVAAVVFVTAIVAMVAVSDAPFEKVLIAAFGLGMGAAFLLTFLLNLPVMLWIPEIRAHGWNCNGAALWGGTLLGVGLPLLAISLFSTPGAMSEKARAITLGVAGTDLVAALWVAVMMLTAVRRRRLHGNANARAGNPG